MGNTSSTQDLGFFPLIRFDYSAKELESICSAEQRTLLATLDGIGQAAIDKPTYQDTVGALEKAFSEFSNQVTPLTFLRYVSPSPSVRAAADRCEGKHRKTSC